MADSKMVYPEKKPNIKRRPDNRVLKPTSIGAASQPKEDGAAPPSSDASQGNVIPLRESAEVFTLPQKGEPVDAAPATNTVSKNNVDPWEQFKPENVSLQVAAMSRVAGAPKEGRPEPVKVPSVRSYLPGLYPATIITSAEARFGAMISGTGDGKGTKKTIFGPNGQPLLETIYDKEGHVLSKPSFADVLKAKVIMSPLLNRPKRASRPFDHLKEDTALSTPVKEVSAEPVFKLGNDVYVLSEEQPVPGRKYFTARHEAPHGGYFFYPAENRAVKIIVDHEGKADSETVYDNEGRQIGETVIFDKPPAFVKRTDPAAEDAPAVAERNDAEDTIILREKPQSKLVGKLRDLLGGNSIIASLGKGDADSESGQERRRKIAKRLGVAGGIAGGIGTVMAVKMTATTVALWLGAPALGVAAAGVLGTMAAAGTLNYFMQRRAATLNSAFAPGPRFGDFFKPAAMAGSMAVAALAFPVVTMLAVGTAVAGVSAGVYEYNSKRKEAGLGFSFKDFGRSLLHSKAMHRAALTSGLVGGALALVGLGGSALWSSYTDHGLVVAPDTASGSAAPVAEAPASAPVQAPAPAADATVVESPQTDTPAVAAPTATQGGDTNASAAPVTLAAIQAPAPATPVTPAPAAQPETPVPDYTNMPPVSVTTDANGVRTTVYASGIIETATPIVPETASVVDTPVAPALSQPATPQFTAATQAAPPVAAPAAITTGAGQCVVSDASTPAGQNIAVVCDGTKLPPQTVLNSRTCVDFHLAGQNGAYVQTCSAEGSGVTAAALIEDSLKAVKDLFFNGPAAPKP